MRFIGRVIALLGLGVVLSAIVGAIAARSAKGRIVPIDAPDADEIALVAVFEPLSFRSTARSFRVGTVDCWYGGGVIDLREATLDPAGARLRVKAVFGGGQILVPDTWRVDLNVQGIGGIGDSRPHADRPADAPHLTIEGIAIFGGFGVATDMPEAAAQGLEAAVSKVAARRQAAPETSEDAVPVA